MNQASRGLALGVLAFGLDNRSRAWRTEAENFSREVTGPSGLPVVEAVLALVVILDRHCCYRSVLVLDELDATEAEKI